MRVEKRRDEPTKFQHRVYDAVCLIPYGRVATYRTVARAINCGSARAIGQALRECPFGEEVPCHRVVASGPRLGGFGGAAEGPETREKRRLLEAEGVAIAPDGSIPPSFAVEELG